MQQSDRALAWTSLACLALATVGCVSFVKIAAKERTTVVERAAFDLGCDGVEVTALGDTLVQPGVPDNLGDDTRTTTYGVRGCGQKAVYVVQCMTFTDPPKCSAVLNSDTKPSGDER